MPPAGVQRNAARPIAELPNPTTVEPSAETSQRRAARRRARVVVRAVYFPADASTGFLAGGSSGLGLIHKTTDGGSNWVVKTPGGPLDQLRGICFPTDATTGYMVGSSATILKTTDGSLRPSSATYF